MKKILSLTLAFVITTVGSLSFADDSANVTIWVKKNTETTAMVCTDSKCLGTVPVKFATDASWDNVKDTYSVSPDIAAALGAKKEAITIGSDGSATFTKCQSGCKAAKK